ncbi:S1/P1 nuclease [uncultured Paludibacter sp.]|uniref:S1/P1 nuclease n=1 Tax=uncultured Paludibacter sp. TaxID=497635 RepID=A0A653AGR6_9BACT|nr:S1/P1 nuclease [uncultured Paludibacter sp.]
MKRLLFTSVLFAVLVLNTFAYDMIGHRTVADIAYHNLNIEVKKQVDNLLGIHGLIYFSTWADDMRNDSTYAYSYNWHFQNLPDSLTTQDLQNLWNNPLSQGEHLFFAIQKMIERLKKDKNDTEALKFLVHFLGDLHQPFHLGREGDRGGNDIQTKWFGQNIRVHQLWDTNLIEHQGYSYTEYSQYLQDKYSKQKSDFKNVSIFQSIQAVYALRQELYTYDYAKMHYYEYNFKYKDKLDEMLYRAGIQLANILNKIYTAAR